MIFVLIYNLINTFSVTDYTESNERMKGERLFVKDVERSCRGQFKVLSRQRIILK
jgi:hypothetical protein